MDTYQVIVLAAGQGKRMNVGKNKQFLHLAGQPLIIHTLQTFEDDPRCTSVLLVVNPAERKDMEKLVQLYEIKKIKKLIDGGSERQESVYNGLLSCDPKEYVLIHDGARPFVNRVAIHKLVDQVKKTGAALLAVAVSDTIKSQKEGVLKTLDRKYLWAAQTPQGFRYSIIMDAHEKAKQRGYNGTDDASLVEEYGYPLDIVEGSYDNFKLTTQEDVKRAEILLAQKNHREVENTLMRIGTGYDVHQLVEGRPCIIGGVNIPYEKGLLGHSDADVLLHTVADACLGAIGEGDIGKHFPDTDPTFKDADSKKLLQQVWQLVKGKGYMLGNIDCTIIAQAPKMAPYISQMRENIAKLLESDVTQVNVKATTTEKLGFTGRKEGIAAQVVVLLQKSLD
ncbi:2-C-methyl-D-erythritol 4-phosphate cytidylyltransferase/2-C-methyl-D-erythritol 4-phosphate cytidylyltransferase/2-C-methyl-D-erythritol 2,4-cyclodiphosphate synthase [Salirhabdus euzebyi]|uniref:Bifunctional enzyme IspD/IspF n=1 Tax=Salirhabdus euzebyi TaxID=394506 RepID=A0A841Q9N3_9BACI|nr:bifunctional 2-C-methyl-D-erythritol 4-phosphate cytidylyltransferase/2-C-methyl-D-erythritol 2,4-cyclodiphosphate synthase [Salirhabdus euzebyi]MBB6455211.1 2-C-methyl-D-erythritol 4-phosphate cytidylyltransferase/2-C-methyl-D-erythritol 4-phosphate cytidylyltransferase/2-C-methyl-D-erythritol 2,4-cyclodiphosphate synthase [Salirhabdus euzebyi]